MKVLFVIRSLEYGGAERQLVVLAKGLLQRGHDVAVAVFYPGGPFEQNLRESGVRVLPLEKRGRWDLLRFGIRLIRMVRQEAPDVLHTLMDNLITVVVRPFCPSVKMVWGVRCAFIDYSKYDWFSRVVYRLSCALSSSADLIISNSQAGRRTHVADGYPDNKMRVIPNGFDTDLFHPNQESRTRMRAIWGIDDDEVLIGIVGRLDPMKDHATFLDASALVHQVRPRSRFVCVGEGPASYMAGLQERTKALGLTNHVVWAGGHSNMCDVYNALDVLVCSSYGEGLANVIGEAMACGVPCVATDVGDSGLVIGDTGLLVPPKDPAAMSRAILQMVERRSDSRELVRRRIVEKYSVENLIQAIEREFIALCRPTTGAFPSPGGPISV
jgi:glycosyltransferase involved in cell wall biosynthesis